MRNVIQQTFQEWSKFDQCNRNSNWISMKQAKTKDQEKEDEADNVCEVKISTGINICRVRRRIGYFVVVTDQRNKPLLIWAAVEERAADIQMEEANLIKLALQLAKQRGWENVGILMSFKVLKFEPF